jgi:hypothetical protein
MRFGTWNLKSLYRAGSIMTFSKELSIYRLDLVGVQEVRWKGSGTAPAGEYTFFHGKGKENNELGAGFLYIRKSHQRLRGLSLLVMYVRAPTEDKIDNVKDSLYEELQRIFDIRFQVQSSQKDIFKPTIENANLHEISNDNEVRVVNFATFENLIVKRTMFPHPNNHKYAWASPDGENHNQIDVILIGEDIKVYLDVRSFKAADCDSDHYLVVVKTGERLAVNTMNKQGSHKFHIERFSLKKLNEVEGKVKYRVEVSNRFVALEDLDAEVEINTV